MRLISKLCAWRCLVIAGLGQNVEKKYSNFIQFWLRIKSVLFTWIQSKNSINILLLTKAVYYVKNRLGKRSACIYATERRLCIGLAYPTGVVVKLIFFIMFKIWRPSPVSSFLIFIISSDSARSGRGWASAQHELFSPNHFSTGSVKDRKLEI